MRGTFFITTDFINYGNPNYLTWEMVKEMSAAGMDIESHARTHRDLRNRGFQFLVWEILGPIEQIMAHTGKRPRFFCYPSGRYDDAVIRMLRSVETWGAVTTEHGYTHTLANAMTSDGCACTGRRRLSSSRASWRASAELSRAHMPNGHLLIEGVADSLFLRWRDRSPRHPATWWWAGLSAPIVVICASCLPARAMRAGL